MPLKICDNIFLIILITTLPKKKEEKKRFAKCNKNLDGHFVKTFFVSSLQRYLTSFCTMQNLMRLYC